MAKRPALKTGQKRAELLLRKLAHENPELLELNGWASERARWAELAYLLTSRLVAEGHETFRQAIGTASVLGLLEIADLAAASPEHAAQLTLVLEEHELTKTEIKAVVATLRETAKQIQSSLRGHLHRFLRHYAEQMLHELTSHFKFTHLNPWQTQLAFVMWLQNTCNLPISLEDAATLAFCKQHGISMGELVEAADAVQLNLAIVDDLVQLHNAHSKKAD